MSKYHFLEFLGLKDDFENFLGQNEIFEKIEVKI